MIVSVSDSYNLHGGWLRYRQFCYINNIVRVGQARHHYNLERFGVADAIECARLFLRKRRLCKGFLYSFKTC